MKLIVGLGNPGIKYRNSRHNLGSLIVRTLAKKLKVKFKLDTSTKTSLAKTQINSQMLILATPLTYMNLSGQAIKALLEKYNIDTKDILAICDELDLELGRLRLRLKGSHGGHNGLRSTIQHLETEQFSRLRVGIGRPLLRDSESISRFVLSDFKRSESKIINLAIQEAVECCLVWLTEGSNKAMSRFR